MKNIAKTREMLGQIGAACAQVVLGCEGLQTQDFDVDTLSELVWALREILTNAEKLRENAMSTIECAEDDASCDCLWHENLRAAVASGGGVTR